MLALVIGTVGGFVFNWLKMPLAWMLGACVFSTVAAFAGLRIGMRVQLRQGMIIILGVLLGSGFTPDLVQQLGQWAREPLRDVRHDHDRRDAWAISGSAASPSWDKVTCYFAAMPGGLNDMTIMGGAMGGQERCIALAHALRILTVVLTIPGLVPAGERRADQRAHHGARADQQRLEGLRRADRLRPDRRRGRPPAAPAGQLHDGADDDERHRPPGGPHHLQAARRAGGRGPGRGRRRHRLPLRRCGARQAAQGD